MTHDRGSWGHLDVDAAQQIRVDEQGDLEDVLTLPKWELCDASPVVIEPTTQVPVRMETRGQRFLDQIPREPRVVRELHAGYRGCHGHRLPTVGEEASKGRDVPHVEQCQGHIRQRASVPDV